MTRPELRNITAEDYEALYGERPKVSIRGVAAELDGKVIGVAGIAYLPGQIMVFSDIRDELKQYPVFLMKAGRRFAKMLNKYGRYAVATACPKEKNSAEFLKHIGFTKIGSTSDEEVYQWLQQ